MVLPPVGGWVTWVVWARRLTTGQPKPPVPPFKSGVRMRGGCVLASWTATSTLSKPAVRSTVQVPLGVAQRVGDELGDDQHHGFRGRLRHRRVET